MLLIEKMKQTSFSNSERIIVDFILDKEDLIKDYSITRIAQETYTTPSTLIRIAKKLGYHGWHELKEAYLDEVKYLKSHFQNIDPNYPFTNQDTIMNIAAKLTQLRIESANDTLSLMNHDSLQKAVQILRRSKDVRVFCVSNLNYIGEEFVFKLNRIHKRASINPVHDVMYHDAAMMTPDECAICISYSGETSSLLDIVKYLHNNHVPIIAITSIGDNHLSNLATTTLHITTREKSISKIGSFTSLSSISLILDILYSCIFSLNYQANLDYKLSIANNVEKTRVIDNEIIAEHPKED